MFESIDANIVQNYALLLVRETSYTAILSTLVNCLLPFSIFYCGAIGGEVLDGLEQLGM